MRYCRNILFFLTFLFSISSSTQAAAPLQSYAILGDAGYWNGNAKSVQDSIKRANINALIMPGDNLYTSTYEKIWGNWSGFSFPIVAIGNHHDGYAKEVKFFNMPGEYYSKTLPGDIRFLVLNSDNEKTANEQIRWLEAELLKDSAMTFLVWHHPTYTVSSYHGWKEKKNFQTQARELLQRHSKKITALITGHDHIGAFYCLNEIPMLVSGAVWETRIPANKNYTAEDQTEVVAQWVYPANTPTWGRMDIDPETKDIKISFIRAADDKVMFTSMINESQKSNDCQKPGM